MKSLPEILQECPPRHASEITGLREDSWYFLLEDGRLIGRPNCNHYDLLGITAEVAYPDAIKKEFCLQNRTVRICFSDETEGHLYIEIFKNTLNEAQWSALGTLYRRRPDTVVVWDAWFGESWSHGEGSLGDFKREINPLPST
jgi:hypothetical protein